MQGHLVSHLVLLYNNTVMHLVQKMQNLVYPRIVSFLNIYFLLQLGLLPSLIHTFTFIRVVLHSVDLSTFTTTDLLQYLFSLLTSLLLELPSSLPHHLYFRLDSGTFSHSHGLY